MSQCDTCAFGCSGAANEVMNRLKGLIAARAGIPFFCHHAKSGEEYDWRSKNKLGPLVLLPNNRKLCDGWKAMVAGLARRGKFQFTMNVKDQMALRRYQQQLGHQAIAALDAFVAETRARQKKKAKRKLDGLVRAVFDVE